MMTGQGGSACRDIVIFAQASQDKGKDKSL